MKALLSSSQCLSLDLQKIGTQYRRALTGVEKDPVIEKQAYRVASGVFSEPVGVYYGRTYFGEEAKKDVVDMVKKIIETYKNRITKNEFLQPKTKEKAILKLSTIEIKMGYPDKIKEYYKKFNYLTEVDGKGKFVTLDGRVNVDADAISKPEDVYYDEYIRQEGRKIYPPLGISIHKTTEVPFVIYRDGKMGLFDATLDKVMLAPEYNKILIATKTDDGKRRFLVENYKKHFGVVDGMGKSVVPFTMTHFAGIKEIDFDQGKRFVAQMEIATKSGIKYVYVDPASETGLASDLEIDRFLQATNVNREEGKDNRYMPQPQQYEQEND